MNVGDKPELRIAPPYDDALIQRIQRGFSEKLGAEIEFEVVEDASLLCGFVAMIYGTVYDVSGDTVLASISEHLLDSFVLPKMVEKGEGDDAP